MHPSQMALSANDIVRRERIAVEKVSFDESLTRGQIRPLASVLCKMMMDTIVKTVPTAVCSCICWEDDSMPSPHVPTRIF